MSEMLRDELIEIKLDLDGMISLLTVIESSDYYKNTADNGVVRALRNSIELTKDKLSRIIKL